MASSKQKVVLITGCSTGIGLSTAVMLAKDAEKRFKVYATMRNLGKKEALETEGKDVLGSTLIIEQLDVCSEDQINKVVDGILAKEGKLDVLGKLEIMYYYNTTFQQRADLRGGRGAMAPPKRYDFTPIEFELKRQPIHKLNM